VRSERKNVEGIVVGHSSLVLRRVLPNVLTLPVGHQEREPEHEQRE
jgi:hypothetical protein